MPLDLAGFNTAPADRVRPILTACLDVPRWVDTLLDGRPYPDFGALVGAAEAASPLLAAETRRAIAAHPRIGERATGWSRSEQSGVDRAAAGEFREANAAYERRFGHVYLVCASGRGGGELLADLQRRMGNDAEAELRVAGAELLEIAVLRLTKAVLP